MQPSLTVNRDKQTEFDFDVSVSGLSNVDVRLVIKESTHDISIHCERAGSSDTWVAKIPALGLKVGNIPYQLEVIGEQYFCKIADGTLKIVSSPSAQMNAVVEQSAPVIEVKLKEAKIRTPEKQRIVLEVREMDQTHKTQLMKSIGTTSTVLERAGKIMNALTVDNQKMTSKSLLSLVEMVKTAVASVESNLLG